MIRLRELREDDAQFMIEWMHDPDYQKCFKKNMLGISLEDAKHFCNQAKISDDIKNGDSLHFAVVDDLDEYMGTISLKDIDWDNSSAEYAIVIRKSACGKGYAYRATHMLLDLAFRKYGLHRVYLNVFSDNTAAIKLYEKCGFIYEGEFREHICRDGKFINWKWYGILHDEYTVK